MELLDVYDDNGVKTGKVVPRGSGDEMFEPHEHIAVSIIFIENSKGEFLIQRTAKNKGDVYSSTGGHIDSGETPYSTIIREVKEELGLDISNDNVIDLGFRLFDFPLRYLFYLKKDIKEEELNVQKSEVKYAKFMSVNEINNIINKKQMNSGHATLFKEIISLKKGHKI